VHTKDWLHADAAMCMYMPSCNAACPLRKMWWSPEGRKDGGDIVGGPRGCRPCNHAVRGADAPHMLQRRCTPLCRQPQAYHYLQLDWQRCAWISKPAAHLRYHLPIICSSTHEMQHKWRQQTASRSCCSPAAVSCHSTVTRQLRPPARASVAAATTGTAAAVTPAAEAAPRCIC
jgi:hypothetical protein